MTMKRGAAQTRPAGAPGPVRAFRPRLVVPTAFRDTSSQGSLATTLLRQGLVETNDLIAALKLQALHGGRLEDVLLARGLVSEPTLDGVLASLCQIEHVDLD